MSTSNSTTGNTTSTNSTSSSSSSSSAVGVGVGSSVSGVVIAIIIVLLICLIRKRKKGKRRGRESKDSKQEREINAGQAQLFPGDALEGLEEGTDDLRGSSQFGPRNYSYKELSIATKNFSQSELLGAGGFGSVHRGLLREDGTYVAVKSIAANSKQGAREYKAEVTIISDLRHRNLVRLRGWCHEQAGQFLLVYDYMPNGSLDALLFNDALCSKLTWERRFAIVIGLGSALLYLHEECDKVIIHRDIKSSNVLLDENFNAKLGDFGLSRQVTPGITSHTTVLAGTRGYMAPECFFGSGKASRETDVFAFGAVLLELVCGRGVIDWSLVEHDCVLVDWVWDLYSQGKVMEAVDRRLEGRYEKAEVKRVVLVGLTCSNPDPKARPNMRRALEALMGTATLPSVPLCKPGLVFGPPVPMSMSEILGDSCSLTPTSTSTLSTSISTLSTSTSTSSLTPHAPKLASTY